MFVCRILKQCQGFQSLWEWEPERIMIKIVFFLRLITIFLITIFLRATFVSSRWNVPLTDGILRKYLPSKYPLSSWVLPRRQPSEEARLPRRQNYNAAQCRQKRHFWPYLGVSKTPYLGSDVIALYLQLVVRNLPRPYTASFQALSVNAFRWRIRDERPGDA